MSPQVVESCVSSLLEKWHKTPSEKPKRDKAGKEIKTPAELRAVAWAICQASQKESKKQELKQELDVLLDFPNPVIVGIAATNRPHIMGLQPVSVIDRDGKQMVKVPLLLFGKWKYGEGILDFDDAAIEKMVKNFKDGRAGHDVAFDCRHLPELGALGWARDFDTEQRPDGKKQFNAYVEPTLKGKETVEEGRFRYASVEFHPNFQDRSISMSTDNVIEEFQGKEFSMGENQEEGTLLVATPDQVSLEVERMKTEMEAYRVQLSQATGIIRTLESALGRQHAEAIVAQAKGYRDKDQRAHGKVFIDWLQTVLLGDVLADTIKLENDSVGNVHAYYRKAAAWLSANMPGVVPMESARTVPDTERPLDPDKAIVLSDEDKAEIDRLWKIVG
jgi:hypothetical protein